MPVTTEQTPAPAAETTRRPWTEPTTADFELPMEITAYAGRR